MTGDRFQRQALEAGAKGRQRRNRGEMHEKELRRVILQEAAADGDDVDDHGDERLSFEDWLQDDELRDLLGVNDPEKMIRAAYRQVLFRVPQPDEVKALSNYVEQRSDRPTDAIRQMVWAMMTSTEFRFNY